MTTETKAKCPEWAGSLRCALRAGHEGDCQPFHHLLPPLDIRWWVSPCGLLSEHVCTVTDRRSCHGCLGNGFRVDLSSIEMVVSAHKKEFTHLLIRGPQAPKPWEDNPEIWEVGSDH